MKDQFAASRIIKTKLTPFSRLKGYVRQEDLFRRLQRALDHRLTIISAAAGYGKTSLLSDFYASLQESAVRVAWLTLDEEDSSPVQFLSYLYASLENAGVPLSGYKPAAERSLQDVPVRAVIASIFRSIEILDGPVVLILDDYHRGAGKELDGLFEWLVRFSPPQLHILVASREYPQIMREDLRVRGALLEFTSLDLAFTADDVRRAFAANGVQWVEPRDILRLTDRTEGWPLAVELAIKWSLGDQAKAREVSEFSGQTHELARYLSEQLLSRFAGETQTFLLQTSILPRISGDLANEVTGRSDSWSLLEKLEQQNVFISSMAADGRWFRYHPLVAEFLTDRLRRLDRQDIGQLHRRAAQWFGDHGFLNEALLHASQSLDEAYVATLLERAGGWRLILEGRISLIRHYLPPADSVHFNGRPRLQLARVFLLIKRGHIDEAEAYFASIRPALQDPALSTDVRLEAQMVGNIISEYQDDPVTRADIDKTEQLISALPANESILLALANESLAARYYSCGLLAKSLEAIARASRYYEKIGSLYSQVFTHFHQALVRLAQGAMQEAEKILNDLIRPVQENFGPASDLAANLAAFRAAILYEKNDIAAAHELLSWALPHMEASDGWFDVYYSGYLTAAHCAFRIHGPDAALDILRRARVTADRRHLKRLRLAADLCEMELLIESGDPMRAQELAHEVDLYGHVDKLGGESILSRQLDCRLGIAAARLNAALGRRSEHLQRMEALAQSEGLARQLMEIRILRALDSSSAGDADAAARHLDRAISAALFEGNLRIFVREGSKLLAPLRRLLNGEARIPEDRFRDAFIREIQRLIGIDDRLSESARCGYVFSQRELDTLRILDTGLTNKEIAKQLRISPSTVKYRLKSLFAKLQVSTRKEAVKLARDKGWLSRETTA